MWVMTMNPGDLKQRLIFQTPAGGVDDDGYPVNEPTEYTKAWGSLKTLKGRTRFIAAQTQMEHNREFTIRFQSKLLDGVRPNNLEMLWRGKKHKIESIEDDDGLKETMTVVAEGVS